MRKISASMPAGRVDLVSRMRNFIYTTKRTSEIHFAWLKSTSSRKSPIQDIEDSLESLFQEKMIPVVLIKKANR